MNPHDWAMLGTLLFSGVNTAVVVAALWKGARWTGIVDTRLGGLDTRLGMVEQAVSARRELRRATDNP